MLQGLRIANFAVIDEAELSFDGGLTVLTGETGAGKSILVDALGLLLGGRADPDMVRASAEEATVEGFFGATPSVKAKLSELGLPDLGDELSVRRVIGRAGRGRAYVNGSLVTVGVLGKLMRGGVDIAGQHEHMALFDSSAHRALLDAHGELYDEQCAYRAEFAELLSLDRRMASLGGDDRQVQQRVEFLRFQLEELQRLSPKAGEDAALEEERRRLSSSDKLHRAATFAEGILTGEESGVLVYLRRARAVLVEVERLDPKLQPMVKGLEAAFAEAEDAARSLSRYAEGAQADPERLTAVDDRLDALRRLCRKHGCDVASLEKRQAELSAELSSLTHREEELAALTKDRDRVVAKVVASGEKLSSARKSAAKGFCRAVLEGLCRLAMPQASFEISFRPLPQPGPEGLEEVEFLFSANPGEPPRPLSKVASGGEASRVLLSLRRAAARADPEGVLVLDEADAGVGGAVAEAVGRLLKEVSAHRQVLCITHLPQVAAYGDCHLFIHKDTSSGRTVSRVRTLSDASQRRGELARMLSGLELTPEALGAAEALLRSALRAEPKRGAPPSQPPGKGKSAPVARRARKTA